MENEFSEANKFWQRVIEVTQHAVNTGALHSIPTECELIEDGGIEFIVRILDNLERKDQAKKEQKQKQKSSQKTFNPFLPYEQDLFVSDLSDTHVCILNKFNVVDHHLLLITREFESQENFLNLADFTAICHVLREIDGLGFYNGGKLAGASQPHKHLQVVPLPMAPNTNKIPVEKLILSTQVPNKVAISPHFPFLQAIAFFDLMVPKSTLEIAKIILDYYHQLLEKVGLESSGKKQSGAYNLLITRKWMFLVPREQESFKSISINSLGFAGALLVKNEKRRQILLKHKPMNILQKVAIKLE
jgi:ATP adenylyltransferase